MGSSSSSCVTLPTHCPASHLPSRHWLPVTTGPPVQGPSCSLPSRGHLFPQNNALCFTVLTLPSMAAVSRAGHSRQPSGVREANIFCTTKFKIFLKLYLFHLYLTTRHALFSAISRAVPVWNSQANVCARGCEC